MVTYKIKTNDAEAQAILTGDIMHIIRNVPAIKRGDILKFQVVKNMKSVYHPIGTHTYRVTRVDDYLTAPIAEYNKLISFKEIP